MVKLKRTDDYEILKRIDDKVDIITTTLATTCEKVAVMDRTVNGNGQKGHAQRIASLEKYIWMGIGGLGVLEVVLRYAVK